MAALLSSASWPNILQILTCRELSFSCSSFAFISASALDLSSSIMLSALKSDCLDKYMLTRAIVPGHPAFRVLCVTSLEVIWTRPLPETMCISALRRLMRLLDMYNPSPALSLDLYMEDVPNVPETLGPKEYLIASACE